jgi:hypothetical protein
LDRSAISFSQAISRDSVDYPGYAWTRGPFEAAAPRRITCRRSSPRAGAPPRRVRLLDQQPSA